ncbi:hypothetical protein DL764_002234 [Monosporascus ibericus]|uniref:Biogenesis of lysosome-related organelles complex 1 subunit 1 n=1 Tax=Monosporascus ibericus TaxID=155417 RepID=A0A4Q4TMH8_9PEZI|nr:hypothetical protein DL764_002234 [Monosporascus ibericus]
MSTAATATSSAAPSPLVPPPASVPETSGDSGDSPDSDVSAPSSNAVAATAAGPSSGGVTSTATTNTSTPSPAVLPFPLFSATPAPSTSSSSRLLPHSPASSSFPSSHAAQSISVPSPATAISTATGMSTMTNADAPNDINHGTPNANPATANQPPASAIHATARSITASLPSSSNPRHVAEARAALVATVSNLLDTELQGRASLLHGNAAALERQRRDVSRAADGLRRENDRLARLARDAGKAVKELGNVQNWAEVLERDFLVLEETVRLVKKGNGGEDEEDEGSSDGSGGSCSCSDCWSGSETGSVVGGADDAAGPDSGVKVELSDAVVESLAEAMATEGFFKAAAVDKGNGNGNGRGSATGDLDAMEFRDESSTAEVARTEADSVRA